MRSIPRGYTRKGAPPTNRKEYVVARSLPLAGGGGSLRGGTLLGARGVELAALVPAGGLAVLAPTPLHRIDDANGLLAVGAGLEEHLAVAERKEGVILAGADARARVNLRGPTGRGGQRDARLTTPRRRFAGDRG